jgi:hypothetical protein
MFQRKTFAYITVDNNLGWAGEQITPEAVFDHCCRYQLAYFRRRRTVAFLMGGWDLL